MTRRRPPRCSSITSAPSKPKASTSCARWWPSSSGRSCSIRSARTRRSCCGWRRRPSTPGRFPFPLLHVDTTYKFREMIQFRDEMAKAVGARLIVHTNQEAIADGTQPFKVGTQRCCGLLKTKSLLDALAGRQLRRRHRRRAPRRGALAREGAHLLRPRSERPVGSEAPAARAVEPAERASCGPARASASFRCRTGPRSTSGTTSTSRTSRSSRSTSPRSARSSSAATR